MRYLLDTDDWPLIINDDARDVDGGGGPAVVLFPLPEGSTGDDAEGLAQLARAWLVRDALNAADQNLNGQRPTV